jgi:hypothetical protein
VPVRLRLTSVCLITNIGLARLFALFARKLSHWPIVRYALVVRAKFHI